MISISIQWILTVLVGVFLTVLTFFVRKFFVDISKTFEDVKGELKNINEKLSNQNILVQELKYEKNSLVEKVASLNTRLFSLEEEVRDVFKSYGEGWSFVAKHIDTLRKLLP